MDTLDIFQYGDYRAYLTEYYRREKGRGKGFSYRAFARRAGLSSPNYLKLVIDGSRPVTEKNIAAFLRGLRLSGPQSEYFRILVSLKESREEKEKEATLERLLKMRARYSGEAKQLHRDRWEIMRSWHHWAIREMVLLKDFQPEPGWIAARLGRKITPAQARESLELLRRLEFLKPDPDTGRLMQAEPMISTSDEIVNLMLKHLHRQFVELSLISLFHDPTPAREASGLTLALRQEQVGAFKKMLKDFRRELNRLFSDAGEAGADHVYHLEMIFFPVTKVENGGRDL